MLIVKKLEKSNVLKAIIADRTHLESLSNNIQMLLSTDRNIIEQVNNYAVRNAVLNSIVKECIKVNSRKNFLETINVAVDSAATMLNILESYVSKSKNNIFDNSTFTYRENGIFEWLNAINFFTRYTSKVFDILVTQPTKVENYLTKGDLTFINQTVDYYKTLINRLMESRKSMVDSIENLSDEPYDVEYISIIEDIKGKNAVSTGIAPRNLNPKYWYDYGKMLYDVRTFKRNIEEIDMAAMKIQRLENMKANNPDPSIDSQIEYWQNNIQILNAEIEELKERYR